MPLDKNEQVVIDGRKCTVACALPDLKLGQS